MQTESYSRPYLAVSRASDLSGGNRTLYRALEMLPAILSYGTLILLIVLSFFFPSFIAFFTIAFSVYWLGKTIFLSIHLYHNFKRLRHNMALDWQERLKSFPKERRDQIAHVVLFPFYNEPYEVMEPSVRAIAENEYDSKRIAVVLAAEERAGEDALKVAERVRSEYQDKFLDIIISVHPADVPGELAGKGSNIAFAGDEARRRILDVRNISYDDAIVSAFDVDTVAYPKYFACLTWYFLSAKDPHKVSFQPVPLYNNNIWSAPTLSRLLAYSSTFWQMIEQERPERLCTFSSHAMSMRALYDVGYWQKNMVSEDSRIFWNLYMANDGDYSVVPISYPVSMDANVTSSFWGTVKNLYKQHRRWSYGAENIPYVIFHFIKNPRIALRQKIHHTCIQLEGFWSLATHPLILFAVGWLPLLVGGHVFNASVLSYNLPIIATWFLSLATLGLLVLAVFFVYLIPERPKEYPMRKSTLMFFQWVLVPLTMVIFSSIPGLDAQGRLFLGKYLGFWVTPKIRG